MHSFPHYSIIWTCTLCIFTLFIHHFLNSDLPRAGSVYFWIFWSQTKGMTHTFCSHLFWRTSCFFSYFLGSPVAKSNYQLQRYLSPCEINVCEVFYLWVILTWAISIFEAKTENRLIKFWIAEPGLTQLSCLKQLSFDFNGSSLSALCAFQVFQMNEVKRPRVLANFPLESFAYPTLPTLAKSHQAACCGRNLFTREVWVMGFKQL